MAALTRQLSIDTLRLLAVDAVEKANSGHPGAPLGCAPIAYLLFHKLMKHNPRTGSGWTGTGLCCRTGTLRRCSMGRCFSPATSDDGRPEELPAVGIEDAGPSRIRGHGRRGSDDRAAGAGIAMSVGMAIAERHLAAIYNKPGFEIVNHHTLRCAATAT
jgi:transketolase